MSTQSPLLDSNNSYRTNFSNKPPEPPGQCAYWKWQKGFSLLLVETFTLELGKRFVWSNVLALKLSPLNHDMNFPK